VVVLHGGPAAAGEVAPIARELADSYRVLEPWQRGSGGDPLTVAWHVRDLHNVVTAFCGRWNPVLVGHSWGAMLALVYAASHPDWVKALVLVGCGTFDERAREKLHATLRERTDADLQRELDALDAMPIRSEEKLRRRYELTRKLYDYDAEDPEPLESGPLDVRAHIETWNDMLRLQAQGIYPSGLYTYSGHVLMLHGAHDPHPGPLIRDGLMPVQPLIQYHELARCGHCPWRERGAREEFFSVLRDFLHRNLYVHD
jgi:pimeloyl-ACP methyl ester carboxylesterase